MNNHIVIMAGGIGSRLWPLSTPECPKQFADVMGCGKSLIQLTVERFKGISSPERIWIVTGERYVDLVREHLPEVPAENILAEPMARNTAPCIAYACWSIKKRDPRANIVVTPADAFVSDTEEFRSIIRKALEFTANQEAVVTIGIKPNRPETGYGYIAAGEAVEQEMNQLKTVEANQEADRNPLCKVSQFKEKPNREIAEEYLKAGNYFWNAGIFVWNVNTIVAEMKRHTPQLATLFDGMNEVLGTPQEREVIATLFPTCESISIDYAVMEKTTQAYVLPADFGWSDLGNWSALHALLPHDSNNNSPVGSDIRCFDTQNTLVHAPDKRLVIVQGLEGYIVADKGDTLLICKQEEEQQIKDYTK
ncbi:MAG: mannose-1-phosphate guanylyltransferase [Phocaeicola sp.]